jgi:hypothetical protein
MFESNASGRYHSLDGSTETRSGWIPGWPGKKCNTTSNRKLSAVLAGKLDSLERRLSGLTAKAIFDKEQCE